MKSEESFCESTHWIFFDRLKQHVRYSLRQMRKSPGFTLTAVLTLGLGIGGTTAIFSLIHLVLLTTLPVANPDRLYRVGDNTRFIGVYTGLETSYSIFSYDLYMHFRDNSSGFEELAAFQSDVRRMGLRRSGSSEPAQSVYGQMVSGNYFSTFGVDAIAGRVFNSIDDRPDSPPVAVMSHHTWQQKYGRDPSVIGSTFNVNTIPVTIVGVAPPAFFGDTLRSNPPDLWLPLSFEPLANPAAPLTKNPDIHWLYMIGRVRAPANSANIEGGLQVALQQWLQSRAANMSAEERTQIPSQTVRLSPGGAGIESMRTTYESSLRLLIILSGFVLLIVCANIANLALVRGLERRHQTAISVALGAPRSRLVAQALTESILLAVMGGAAGLAFAFAGTRMLLSLVFPSSAYVPISATPSTTVLLFALTVAVFSGLISGIAPAWLTSRADAIDGLRATGRSTTDGASALRKTLVIAQTALSLGLVAAAGLMAQSLRSLENQKVGFETERRLVVRIDPTLAGYKANQLESLYRSIKEQLLDLPGVLGVSCSLYSPMSGSFWSGDILVQGQAPPPANSPHNVYWWNRVDPDYFETIGTRIVKGRAITDQDTAASRHVAVVNEAFARRVFGNEDVIGKHFGKSAPKFAGDLEIVGVTENTKYLNPKDPAPPMYFLPITQFTQYDDPSFAAFETRSRFINDVVLRLSHGAQSVESQIRNVFATIDPNLTVFRIQSLDYQVNQNFNKDILIFRLILMFGITALALASIGLYGVTSYAVQRRTKEIGIRVALGANRAAVLAIVLRGALPLTGIGLLLGIPLALIIGSYLSAHIYGVASHDPLILLGSIAVLSMSAFAAVAVPARRAASVDPIRALRADS